MVLFPDAPPAAPWELLLVDKIFQKGGNGAQGFSRFLQRHVRHSDSTPPGAILNADFRRTVLELNVGVTDATYDAVVSACAFAPPRDGVQSHFDATDSCLSVRALATRLANIAQSGSGISAVYAPVGENPMTGFATARVPASTRRAARANATGLNDPDYYPPTRGSPNSPRAPAASSDPNNMLYDNLAGGGDFVGRKSFQMQIATENAPVPQDDFEFVGSPPGRSSFDSPGRESRGMGGFANLTIDVPGEDELSNQVTMSPKSPKGMSPLNPTSWEGFNGDPVVDTTVLQSPDRAAMKQTEHQRVSDFRKGAVSEKSVTPSFPYPAEHFASDAFPSLDTVEKVEEAMRVALLTRTSSRAAAMRLVAGIHPQGGRIPSGDVLTLEQFKLAMRRVNVCPANETVTEEVFRKHDRDGNGSLDYQEFIRYLMPGDFETESPSMYRSNYVGYTAPPDRFRRGEITQNSVEVGGVTPAGLQRGSSQPSDKHGAHQSLLGRDQRMHAMLPVHAGGKATAGDATYEHGAFTSEPQHDLTARRIEAAMLEKLRGENGGDATVKQFVDVFKFFDDDGVGVVSIEAFKRGLRRLNVDPTQDTLAALVTRHETSPGSNLIGYKLMAKRVVPLSAQEREKIEKLAGNIGERWGADGGDTLWAGYDRSRLDASLEKLQEPSVFDRGKAGDAGYVPMVKSVAELEHLLGIKTLERTSNSGKSARNWWKYFDRDGSGAMSRSEFETAIARFNIAAEPEVITEVLKKYDTDGDGEIDYCEMLRFVCPEGVRDRHRDTVASMRNMRHFKSSEVVGDGEIVRVEAPQLTLGAPRPATTNVPSAHVSVVRFQKLLLDWMQTRGQGVNMLRKLFKQMDTDGDGALTYHEFEKGLHQMHIYSNADDLNSICRAYDTDGDGFIMFDEFINSVLPEHLTPGYSEGNWQSIAHHDPKPDNIIPTSKGLYEVDFDKLLADKIISKLDKFGSARTIFRGLDTDRSGFVDRQEFKQWLKVMNFFPDDESFDKLWKRYDPQGKGLMSYDHFVRRVTSRHDPNRSVF